MVAQEYKVMTFFHLLYLKDEPMLNCVAFSILSAFDFSVSLLANPSCGMKLLWNWLEQSLIGRF